MKKLFFFAAISSVFAFNNVHAQSEMSTFALNTAKAGAIISGVVPNETLKSINGKALKKFSKDYKNATTAEWYQLKDKSFLCQFTEKGVTNKAFYSNKGSWLGTISSYQEAHLPKDVRAIVKRTYYDYAITFVNEINLSDYRTVYLIHIQDEKTLKILRIEDGEMEVVQELDI